MIGAGTKERERYLAAMAKIQPGAVLASRERHWTVKKLRRTETGVDLTLSCGRRSMLVYVAVCYSGPCLWESGLKLVSVPPSNREMFSADRSGA